MSVRRSRARRDAGLARLQARVDALADKSGCNKLVHMYIAGDQRPHATPGCAACAELQREYDAAPPPPTPQRSSARSIDDEA